MKQNKQILSSIVEIKNMLGLHARPSASFVKTANEFDSDISVENDELKVNGKSIMGLMMLGAGRGSKLKITAEGNDAFDAIKSLELLVNNKFGEV